MIIIEGANSITIPCAPPTEYLTRSWAWLLITIVIATFQRPCPSLPIGKFINKVEGGARNQLLHWFVWLGTVNTELSPLKIHIHGSIKWVGAMDKLFLWSINLLITSASSSTRCLLVIGFDSVLWFLVIFCANTRTNRGGTIRMTSTVQTISSDNH